MGAGLAKCINVPETSADRFTLESEQLGQGAFGQVVLCRDHSHQGRLCAAKLIPLGGRKPEQVMEEAKLMQAAAGPYICEMYAAGIRAEDLVIFIELCPNGDLLQHVNSKGILSESEASVFFTQLMTGVAHLHSLGIVHCDIKLENLLLTDECQSLRIVDFGLSQQYPKDDAGNLCIFPLRRRCGSRSYCAPEVLGRVGYSFAADVWSCGVCLFAMLFGFFPLAEATETDWRFKKLCEAQRDDKCVASTILQWYNKPQFLSARALNIVDQLLEVDQEMRIRASECLTRAWCKVDSETFATVDSDNFTAQGSATTASASDKTTSSEHGIKGSLSMMLSTKWDAYVTRGLTRLLSTMSGLHFTGASEEDDEEIRRPVYRGTEYSAMMQSVWDLDADISPPAVEQQYSFAEDD
mmetsp:Transcript_5813/g.12692  ORF Transcript_5813/g.12692 Transcript_5813/m.12692 type:complete len:410 (+) Transcript_5813:161-1390(+)